MFWFAVAWLAFWLLAFLFKTAVIWSVESDPLGGGGAPTVDYVLFYPIAIAFGITILLRCVNAMPFPGFGWLVYGVILTLSTAIYCLIPCLARPREQEGSLTVGVMRDDQDEE